MNDTIILTLNKTPEGDWKLGVSEPTPVASTNSAPQPKYRLEPARDGLFRPVALRNIYDQSGSLVIREGSRGGLIWGEEALSQFGSCWVSEHAQVTQRARVREGASVLSDAKLSDHAVATGNSYITTRAQISGYAQISGTAQISGDAQVKNHAQIMGNSIVDGNAVIDAGVQLVGTQVTDSAHIESDDGFFLGSIHLTGDMQVTGCRSVLSISTCWGPLTVAPCRSGRWLGSVGCQRFQTFHRLGYLAREHGQDFEQEMLPHWFEMMRRAFQEWGLAKSVIDETTAARETHAIF
jgi:hypothetical protein